jgi:hypothetical protein
VDVQGLVRASSPFSPKLGIRFAEANRAVAAYTLGIQLIRLETFLRGANVG